MTTIKMQWVRLRAKNVPLENMCITYNLLTVTTVLQSGFKTNLTSYVAGLLLLKLPATRMSLDMPSFRGNCVGNAYSLAGMVLLLPEGQKGNTTCGI